MATSHFHRLAQNRLLTDRLIVIHLTRALGNKHKARFFLPFGSNYIVQLNHTTWWPCALHSCCLFKKYHVETLHKTFINFFFPWRILCKKYFKWTVCFTQYISHTHTVNLLCRSYNTWQDKIPALIRWGLSGLTYIQTPKVYFRDTLGYE